ncbi:M57 family metalloprotease [Spirosoma sp. 209]|uniref:M57 family metalloprotease n=1 Tax=Spirosoma sp. 209 TaxID=1955701 RepID=UPI0013747F2D|nr:M57 family metalloprotease [Spirosoma sp. 209]
MKTSFLLTNWSLTGLVLASLLLLNNACQPVTDALAPQAGQVDNSPAVRAYIRSLGCPDSLIHDAGDHFLADGDLLFPKNMALSANGVQEEQAYQVHEQLIYNGSVQIQIGVYIHPDFKNSAKPTRYIPGVVDLVTKAIAPWNSLGRNLVRTKFYIVSDRAQADILIDRDESTAKNASFGQYVTGTPPTQGNPGKLVLIHYPLFKGLDYTFKVAALSHAFGHCLGLVHTDWKKWSNELPALQVPGSPVVDNLSIMNRLADFTTPSDGDINALRVMYPATAYGFKLSSAYEAFSNSSPVLLTWRGPLHKVKGFDVAYSALGNPTGDGVYAPITFKAGNVSYSRILFRFKRPANVDPNAYKPQVRTYRVRVRTRYSDGSVGNWSPVTPLNITL